MSNSASKITRIEVLHIDWRPGKSGWVRLHTEEGLYGLGEVSPMGEGRAALEIIANCFVPKLLGANSLDYRILQEQLFQEDIKLGPDGAFAAAVAAIDIALWDLNGKILNQPIYQLLGGAKSTSLPFYASIGGNAHRSVEQVCKTVEVWQQFQPSLIKIRLDSDRTTRDFDVAGDIAKAIAVRELVGEEFPLAFDANNNYSVQNAIRVGRVLEELNYEWFEEPVHHLNLDSLEKVASALDIAVSAGEQEYTLQAIHRLINVGVSIVQPDIVKTGGFTGLLDMAALARSYGVDFVPHQTQPTIGHTANLHFVAALPFSHHPCEYNDASGRQNAVFTEPIQPVDGRFQLTEAPGLGLEIAEAALLERSTLWRT